MTRKRMRARGWKIGVELSNFVIEMLLVFELFFVYLRQRRRQKTMI